MRAAVLREPRRIEVRDRPVPEPGPGEARLRVAACGLCGTDLHFYELGPLAADIAPGHEMAGAVDALGLGVEGLAIGDRVVVEPLFSCGSCDTCRRGRDALCTRLQVYGLHRDGRPG